MALEQGWEITHKSAKFLSRWDMVCANNLKNIKIPQLRTDKKLTVIDVGANTGTFAELLLKETPYDFDQLILFEPVPLYSRWASFKFSCLLDDPCVKVFEYALSDKKGIEKIAINNKDGNFGWNTMVEDWQESCSDSVLNIPTLPFDEVYKKLQLKDIDLIKIDVEGYEVKVLKGMKETLASLEEKPPIIVEIADGSSHHDLNELKITLNNLKNLGYVFDDIKEWPQKTFDLTLTQSDRLP